MSKIWEQRDHNRKVEWISNIKNSMSKIWEQRDHNRKVEWISNIKNSMSKIWEQSDHNRKVEWISNINKKDLQGFEEGSQADIYLDSLKINTLESTNLENIWL